jgi:hypothetical protein
MQIPVTQARPPCWRSKAAAISLAALVACASPPTPYQPIRYEPDLPGLDSKAPVVASDLYGYSDQQIAPTILQISFKANSNTPTLQAVDFVLLRSAEAALERGYPYFVVRKRLNVSRQQTYTRTTPGTHWTSCNKKGRCTTTYSPGTSSTSTYVYPNLEYVVELVAEPPSKDDPSFVLDARFLQTSIRRKHDLGAAQ